MTIKMLQNEYLDANIDVRRRNEHLPVWLSPVVFRFIWSMAERSPCRIDHGRGLLERPQLALGLEEGAAAPSSVFSTPGLAGRPSN